MAKRDLATCNYCGKKHWKRKSWERCKAKHAKKSRKWTATGTKTGGT